MSEEMMIGFIIGLSVGLGMLGTFSKDRFIAFLSSFLFGAGTLAFIYYSIPNVIR